MSNPPYKAVCLTDETEDCVYCGAPIVGEKLKEIQFTQHGGIKNFDEHPAMAAMVENNWQWYHFTCFFMRNKPKSTEEIGLFEDLHLAHQFDIVQILAILETPVFTAPSGALGLDKAKKSRSICTECREGIARGSQRVYKKSKEQRGRVIYYHMWCWKQELDKHAPKEQTIEGGIRDLKVGRGPQVRVGSKVSISYEKRQDQKVIEESECRIVIGAEGWEFNLVGMKPGGKRRFMYPLNNNNESNLRDVHLNSAYIYEVTLIMIFPTELN